MNVNKLLGKMAEAGVTRAQTAQAIGMPYRTFHNRLKKGVFGTDEATKLIDFLNIENPSEIFFD